MLSKIKYKIARGLDPLVKDLQKLIKIKTNFGREYEKTILFSNCFSSFCEC